MRNPFVTSGYKGSEYFCGRSTETDRLISLITNGNNVAVISPRRLGKTDLLKHCFEQEELKCNYHTFIVDIYSTRSVAEMVDRLGKCILDSLKPKGKEAWEKFLQALRSIRTGISYDAAGVPSWNLELGDIRNPSNTLEDIFTYIESADKPCIIAIDEFQQITKYEDKNTEALLRTYVQNCRNASFIFSGSHRTLMSEIFVSPYRPFYQSVSLMSIAPIPLEEYIEFCCNHFSKAGKEVDPDTITELYIMFDGVTYYMQRMMNEMFAMTHPGERCGHECMMEALERIIENSSYVYEDLTYQLPEKQAIVLRAIAREDKVEMLQSGLFIRKHNLNSASSVMSAVKGLMEKGLVTNDRGTYYVYDYFLKLWIQRQK